MKSLSCVRLFVTPWIVAYQAPPSMGFSRQEYWSELPSPSPGDLPNPGIEPRSPALQADALPSEPPGKPHSQEGISNYQLSLRIKELGHQHFWLLPRDWVPTNMSLEATGPAFAAPWDHREQSWGFKYVTKHFLWLLPTAHSNNKAHGHQIARGVCLNADFWPHPWVLNQNL